MNTLARIKLSTICVILVFAASFEARGALRVVNYNTAGGVRSGFTTVVDYIGTVDNDGIVRPVDILLLQEQNQTTVRDVRDALNDLYNTNVYQYLSLVGATAGAGLPGVVYNTQTVDCLDAPYIVNTTSSEGAARSTIRYHFRPSGYTSPQASFYIFNSHFKATSDSGSKARRGVEASEVRANADALGEGVHIIYAGDLNLYTSSEQAWSTLTASGNGQAFDPVNRVGSWSNNYSFTDVHTQSPATSEHFPGQILAGMDDRFDFQLITSELMDDDGLSYITGTYYTVGNNNTHTMNQSITTGTDATAAVRNALEAASDHLPVMADYQIPAVMQVAVDPLPEDVELGGYYPLMVSIENDAAANVPADADALDYTISVSGDLLVVGGTAGGMVEPLESAHLYTIELDTSSIGQKFGQLYVNSSSQGAENAAFSLNFDYEVLDNNIVISRSFNWNDFLRHDPNAVLGVDGNIDYHVNPDGQSNVLHLSNQSALPVNVYLAVMDQLVPGDEIAVEGLARSLSGPGGISLGCAYLADTTLPYSLLTDLGTQSNEAGPDWTLLQQTYTYQDQGQPRPVLLYAQIQPGIVCDVNDLMITTKMRTTIQWPLATTQIDCPLQPQMDFNGDCIVNMTDFVQYAVWWLDGQAGDISPNASPGVMITGIVDGPYTGPRAIELYVNGSIDLSAYSIQRSQDGGAWSDGTPLSGIYENEFVYLISTQNTGLIKFETVFGSGGDFGNHALEDTVIDCDGNDAFRLMHNATVVDQIYWPTTHKSYEDSYLYRTDFTGPDAGWASDNWQIPGNDLLDAMTYEETAQAVPFGTYVYSDSECTEQSGLDWNNDCQVNLPDLMEFADQWMQCNRTPDWACQE